MKEIIRITADINKKAEINKSKFFWDQHNRKSLVSMIKKIIRIKKQPFDIHY